MTARSLRHSFPVTWACFALWVAIAVGIMGSSTLAVQPPATPQAPAASVASPESRETRYGVEATLVIAGAAGPDTEASNAFLSLAGKRSSRVVCVEFVEPSPPPAKDATHRPTATDTVARLTAAWLEQGGSQFLVARISATTSASPELLATLESATGIWFEGHDATAIARWLGQPAVDDLLRRHRLQGKVLGGSIAWGLAISAAKTDTAATSVDEAAGGLRRNWLGRLIVTGSADASRLGQWLDEQPRWVGLQLESKASLLLRQRDVVMLDEGTVKVRYGRVSDRRDPSHELNRTRRLADAAALARAAADRLVEAYPPEKLPEPRVAKGTLIIVGGGGTPPGLMKRFLELAGGSSAVIAVLPISNPDPLPEKDASAELFRRLGAKEVVELRGRTPDAVDQSATWELLDRATGIWFGGGRQWRFVDAYEGTKSLEKMRGVLERNGVIGGSSAGATIQGDYLARGHPLGPQIMMADGYERSFAFLPGTAIDQHFTQRQRVGDLLALLKRYPQFLGVGIDESTALIVKGSIGEVVGKYHVHIFDPRRPGADDRPHEDTLAEGARYDLVERKVLEPR